MNLEGPLTEDELDRLAGFLDEDGDGQAMNLEEFDGFVAALVSGPVLVPPSEFLPVVLGTDLSGNPRFQSKEEAGEILSLIMRHWNAAATSVSQHEIYTPILFEGDKGEIGANDWARGFMQGVSLSVEEWADLMEFDTGPGYLFPMIFLAHEHDPDPELRPPPPSREQREDLLAMMFTAPRAIRRHYTAQQKSGASVPGVARRAEAKTGRNEPCPCGSGKKYKHCHLRAGAPPDPKNA